MALRMELSKFSIPCQLGFSKSLTLKKWGFLLPKKGIHSVPEHLYYC